ncbi:hypothetical protein AY607_12260 [Acinetobacter sp. SFA]|nr:hypothetical protein AY607_12260 [Acinetobacter sp. SFA]
MIYLFVFFFVTFYLYFVEKYTSPKFIKQFILWLPAFVVFVFFPAMQSGVGTDYETYFQYFFNHDHDLYLKKNEILYFYIIEFSNFFGDPQVQFIIVSVIQGFLFFLLLYLLKQNGYKAWLIFLIYFLCTGMYHNQMNGLRQYICIYIVPILAIFAYKNKFISLFNFSFISFFIHASSLMSSVLIIIFKRLNNFTLYKKNILFFIFLLTAPIYFIDFKSIFISALEFFNLRFISYMDTRYVEGAGYSKIITKFYYLPIVLLFWFYYLRDNKSDTGMNHFFILIFSFTYFMFLQSLSFELMLRVWSYFNFFLIFPIYYVLQRSSNLTFFLILIYFLIFYIVKVLIFPVAEYEYHFYSDWF